MSYWNNYDAPPVFPGAQQQGGQQADPTSLPLYLQLMRAASRNTGPQASSGGGLGSIFGNSSGGGMGGFGGSPWDALFSVLGQGQGAIQGNNPNSPMVPGNRNPHGSDSALIGAGGPIGGAIGSMFGFGGAGSMAGQNVGATLSDIGHGDIHNLGLDVSQNLPPIPGMRAEGWKGLLNGATGLPLGTLFGALFK